MSSTPTPCAACKYLRRKCTPECIFAPYFPANNPQRFECVHRVYGSGNVGKILKELPPSQREDAVKSLAFQAEARLRDPVYGCTLQIFFLQKLLRQRRADLENAKRELNAYMNPQAIQGPFNPQENPLSSPPAHLGPPCGPNVVQYSAHLGPSYGPDVVQSSAHLGLPDGPDDEPFFKPAMQHNGSLHPDPVQQELLEAQQLAAAVAIREQQQAMMMSNFVQQQQQEYLRHNAAAGIEPSGGQGGEMAPCIGLGTFDSGGGADPQPDPGQQELLEAQQLAAAMAFREQWQAMMMIEQQQQEYLRHNAAAGIEPVAAAAPYGGDVSGHMGALSGGQGGEMAPCMGLGTFDSGASYHPQLQQPPQHGVGGNNVGLATQHHYPLGGQLPLPSEQQALPLTQQQQQQQQQQ